MVFTVRNQAKIANKYIRFAKWKIINLSPRFGEVLYSDIYATKESATPSIYRATVKWGGGTRSRYHSPFGIKGIKTTMGIVIR